MLENSDFKDDNIPITFSMNSVVKCSPCVVGTLNLRIVYVILTKNNLPGLRRFKSEGREDLTTFLDTAVSLQLPVLSIANIVLSKRSSIPLTESFFAFVDLNLGTYDCMVVVLQVCSHTSPDLSPKFC